MARYFVAWLVLLVLLGISVISAFVDIGHWRPVVVFGVAATQAAILFLVFMKLARRRYLTWVFALAGFFWVAVMFGLATADYATRTGYPMQ